MQSALARAYMEIRGDTSYLPSDLQRAKSMLTSSVSSMANIAGGILAASGIGQAASMALEGAKSFVTFNSSIEQYRISLGVMLKDQEQANKLIKDVQQMAAKTPFSTDSLIRGIQLLKSYGFETQRLLPLMKTIGNAAAASPEGMESGVHRISIALGQIQAKGKLMTQEMHQLTEAGVPAWEILSKRLNKSVSAVMQMVEQRRISSATAIEALTSGINERFGRMMEKQSKTMGGMWSTIKDNAQMTMGKIGEPIFGLIKDIASSFLNLTEGDGFGSFTDGIRDSVQVVVDFIRSAFSGVKDFLSPAFETVSSQFWVMSEIAQNVWSAFKESISGIAELLDNALGGHVSTFFEMLKGGFIQLLDYISLFTTNFTKSWEIVANYATDLWYGLVDSWQTIWDLMSDIAMGVVEGLSSAWSALVNNLMVALEDAERLWNKLRRKGDYSTKDNQMLDQALSADKESMRLREEATALSRAAEEKRQKAMKATVKTDAFGNTIQDSASAINQRRDLIEAKQMDERAKELRENANKEAQRADKIRKDIDDRRSGKVDGMKNVITAYGEGAARGVVTSQEKNKAERERRHAERDAARQQARENMSALTDQLRQQRDGKRNQKFVDQQTEAERLSNKYQTTDGKGNEIVYIDKDGNPIRDPKLGASGGGSADSRKNKIPDTNLSRSLKIGQLEQLYSEIQKGIGSKKSPSDDAQVQQAKMLTDEKEARVQSFKDIETISRTAFTPRAA